MSNAITAEDLKVLAEVPQVLRALMEKNAAQAAQLVEYEKRKEAEDIVAIMDNKGLSDPDSTWGDKVNALLESEKSLEVVKQAAEMATSDFGFAKVSTDGTEEVSGTSFETFIQTGES